MSTESNSMLRKGILCTGESFLFSQSPYWLKGQAQLHLLPGGLQSPRAGQGELNHIAASLLDDPGGIASTDENEEAQWCVTHCHTTSHVTWRKRKLLFFLNVGGTERKRKK